MNHNLISIITQGREWSWSLIGLLSLAVGLCIRNLLLRELLQALKARDRNWYQRTQICYQKRSGLGWIFFGLFVFGSALFWRFEGAFLQYLERLWWILIFVSLLVVSFFSHLRAYTFSILEAAEDPMTVDREA